MNVSNVSFADNNSACPDYELADWAPLWMMAGAGQVAAAVTGLFTAKDLLYLDVFTSLL